MKRLLPLLLVLLACNSEPKPPHTYQEYNAILVRLVHEQDSVLQQELQAGKTQEELAAIGRHYNRLIDSIGKEQYRYYKK